MKNWLKTFLIGLLITPLLSASLSAYVSIGQQFFPSGPADRVDLYDFPMTITGPVNPNWTFNTDSGKFANSPMSMTLALRLTGDLNANHPQDSMYGFIQRIVNSLLKSGSGAPYSTVPYLENYLDLTLKRFMDADTSTHVDFDTDTFVHSNVDTNGDGIANGWEPKPLLSGTCLNVPLVGEVCVNMYLYDIDTAHAPNGNIIKYDYNTSDFKIYQNERSDYEESGVAASSVGFSSDNPRSDDDSLDVDVTLNDVQVDVFFEPPHADQITSGTASHQGPVKDWSAFKDESYYTPATDLSNYLKAWGRLIIPTLRMTIGLRILSSYNDEVYPRVVALGFTLKELHLDANLQLVLHDGPYCTTSTPHEDGWGVWAYVDADGTAHYNPDTDNENNCLVEVDGDGVANDSDDATYSISTHVTEIIPFLEAEIRAYMDDIFNNKNKPAPGYYFGPTSLLDIQQTLSGISFDWPLRSGTDIVSIMAGLSSDVDYDKVGEFWSDAWGNMIPFNAGLELIWKYADETPVTSCVWDDAAYTGYVDGWISSANRTADKTARDSDDPYLTRPMNLRYYYNSASTDPFSGVLNGWQLPYPVKNNWAPPGTTSTYKIVDNYPPFYVTPDTYAIGLAVHQNILSMLMYDLAVKGLLCMDIDGNDSNNLLAGLGLDSTLASLGIGKKGQAGGLLNTETFKMIFPALEKQFPDSVMRIRVVPVFRNVIENTSGQGLAVTNPEDTTDWKSLPSKVNVPYAIMGGPPIQSMSFDGLNSHNGIAPDFTFVIPHLLIEFYVYDSSAGNVLRRAFAIDMMAAIGLNIDIMKPGMVPLPQDAGHGGATAGPAGDHAGSYYGYSGTKYPIGCGEDSSEAYPICEITAQTLRVLRIAGLAKPRINAIIEYDEMSNYLTSATAFNSNAVYADALSNLLGIILSSNLSGWAEVGFDIGALIGMPIAVDTPYFGPSFVTDTAGGDGTTGNLSDDDGNGFGDYLEAGVGIYLGVGEAELAPYLLKQIDPLVSGEGSSTLSDMLGSSGGLGGLGLSPASASRTIIPTNEMPPETIIEKPTKISPESTIVKFTAYDPDSKAILFSYRLDGGLWTPYLPIHEAKLSGLWEGKHVLEVKAMDPQGNREATPARYEFVVDSSAPSVQIIGRSLVSSDPVFFVKANDYITSAENIRIAYNLDGKGWSNYSYDHNIALKGLDAGKHTLAVKAVDEAGNVGEVVQSFVVDNSGFGCTMTSGNGSAANFIFLLLLPGLALFVLRRKYS